METADALRILLSTLTYKLPTIIVLIGAIVYCAVNFSKYPKISPRILFGLLILLAADLLSLFIPLLNVYLIKNLGTQSFGYLSFFIGTLFSVSFALGLGLILSAIWMNRTPEKF